MVHQAVHGMGGSCFVFLYPPQTMFVGGILFSRCLSIRDVLVFL